MLRAANSRALSLPCITQSRSLLRVNSLSAKASTFRHGTNCTGSCSWKIYVKNGLVTWETQQTNAAQPSRALRGVSSRSGAANKT